MPARRRNPIDTHRCDLVPANDSVPDMALAVPVIKGKVLSPGVEAIIKLEDATSDNQWELARLYYLETRTKSLRAVADLVGKSKSHVDGNVKIGHSIDPINLRLNRFRLTSPVWLSIWWSAPGGRGDGERAARRAGFCQGRDRAIRHSGSTKAELKEYYHIDGTHSCIGAVLLGVKGKWN
jgi:hypothetical protein